MIHTVTIAVEARKDALIARCGRALHDALWFLEYCEEHHIGQAAPVAAEIRATLKAQARRKVEP